MANNDMRTPGLDDPESILEMRKRHLSLGLRLQALAVAGLQELEAKLKAGKLDMSAEDARTLFATGAELERSALGKREPDDAPVPKAGRSRVN